MFVLRTNTWVCHVSYSDFTHFWKNNNPCHRFSASCDKHTNEYMWSVYLLCIVEVVDQDASWCQTLTSVVTNEKTGVSSDGAGSPHCSLPRRTTSTRLHYSGRALVVLSGGQDKNAINESMGAGSRQQAWHTREKMPSSLQLFLYIHMKPPSMYPSIHPHTQTDRQTSIQHRCHLVVFLLGSCALTLSRS